MTILVVGDANADLSAALERFPREGDDSLVVGLEWGSGGSAANVAVGLALLGAPVRLLARVGRDPAAEIALRAARDAGVELAMVQRDETVATGLCFAGISPGGERTLFSYRGANVGLRLIGEATDLLEGVDWLHIAGHALLEGQQRATTLALIEQVRRSAIPLSLDLCLPLLRAWRDELLDLLPRLAILFANELELAALFPGLARDAALAQAAGDVGLAALKLGPHGCLVVGRALWHAAPAFSVAAVDTNGCGDAFVAGFLYTHRRGEPPEACAMLANAIGALTATRIGAAEAMPNQDSLRAFLAERAQ
ncbi:MAG: carbohydrate kinase family protein [Roseiflexaceae bacterium]